MTALTDRSPVPGNVGPVAPRRENREPPEHDPGGRFARLMPYMRPATLQGPVEAWIRAQGDRPLMASEIAAGIGVRPHRITAILERLAHRMLVRRWKAKMTMPHNAMPGRTVTRRVWLYQLRRD